jgi:hypothetical protein
MDKIRDVHDSLNRLKRRLLYLGMNVMVMKVLGGHLNSKMAPS